MAANSIAPPPNDADDETKRLQADSDAVGAAQDSEIFANYAPTHANPGPPHPGDVAEAASLAATAAPRTTYEVIEVLRTGGTLSNLQLECVQLASQRHLTVLPMQPPTRCGFFLGDGAGVGKGRQLAGIILDNLARGRSKHLWFSSSADLKHDAVRDLSDLGCHLPVHDGCQGLDRGSKGLGLSTEMTRGVLFSTYATLVSATSAQKQSGKSRLRQLVEWCGGPDFEGCLMLDECHKAKNFQPGKEEASSKVAQAVIELQRALPMARVVYCSATGASDLSNMAYMERLGLWGPFSAFATFEAFTEGVKNRGASGSYLSRGLSYREAEFELATVPLTFEQRACFDAAAHFWSDRLLPAVETAVARTQTAAGRLAQQAWSAHQRFFKQLCVSCKVPALVERARAAQADGYAVVIGLQSTGEAALEKAIAADADLRAPISLCRAIVLGFLEAHFPVTKAADAKLDKELNRAEETVLACKHQLASIRAAASSAGGYGLSIESQQAIAQAERMLASAVIAVVQLQAAVDADRAASGQIDPECFAERQRLVDEVNALELPPAALDVLIDELGGKKAVAEMTGRKSRMVRSADGRRFVLEARAKPESSEMENLNVSERNAFMDGKKLIAIISDAASTGISLQADKRVANQRRRCHVTLELPWSADKAVQQLGRSHRANQVSAPLYVLLNTDVGGESRFASAVARRLQALGALTKGDRRAEAGLGALDSFNFDNAWGKRALKLVLHGLADGTSTHPAVLAALSSARYPQMCASLELLGATSPAERDKMEVRRFLNRLLGLPLREQNELFDLFCATLSGVISAARKDGKYDEGIADLSGASVSLEEPETALWSDPLTGAVMSTALVMVDRGVSWHAACERLYVLALPRANRAGLYLLTRPSTGDSPFEEEELDLRRKYEKISPEEARLGWTASYEGALHDKSGGRLSRLQVLTGSTLPLLPLLEGLVKKHAGSLTKRDQSVAAMRVQLGERRLVGVRFPRSLMGDLKAELVAFQQQRQAGAGQHLTVDVARPFDAHAYAQATRPPQTLKNFFGGAASKPAMAPKMAPTTASNLFAASSSTAGLTPTTAPNPTSSIDLTAEISTQSDAAYAQRLQRQYDEESVSAPAPGGKSGLGKDIGNPVLGKDKGKVAVRAAPSGSTGDGGTGVKRKSVLELLGAKQVPRTH